MFSSLKRTLDKVGNTDVIRVPSIHNKNKHIYLKLENQNPSGTIKDRLAKHIILKNYKYNHFVDASIGNFAVSMSWFASLANKKASFFISENIEFSIVDKIRDVGGELIFFDADDLEIMSNQARVYASENNLFFCGQFKKNYEQYYAKTLYLELKKQIQTIDYVVMFYGSGDTIRGLMHSFPEKWKTQFFSATLDKTSLDKQPGVSALEVDIDFVQEVQKYLLINQGVRSGFIGAINAAGAMQVSKDNGNGTILTFISDSP